MHADAKYSNGYPFSRSRDELHRSDEKENPTRQRYDIEDSFKRDAQAAEILTLYPQPYHKWFYELIPAEKSRGKRLGQIAIRKVLPEFAHDVTILPRTDQSGISIDAQKQVFERDGVQTAHISRDLLQPLVAPQEIQKPSDTGESKGPESNLEQKNEEEMKMKETAKDQGQYIEMREEEEDKPNPSLLSPSMFPNSGFQGGTVILDSTYLGEIPILKPAWRSKQDDKEILISDDGVIYMHIPPEPKLIPDEEEKYDSHSKDDTEKALKDVSTKYDEPSRGVRFEDEMKSEAKDSDTRKLGSRYYYDRYDKDAK
jgi:hypothetical protein